KLRVVPVTEAWSGFLPWNEPRDRRRPRRITGHTATFTGHTSPAMVDVGRLTTASGRNKSTGRPREDQTASQIFSVRTELDEIADGWRRAIAPERRVGPRCRRPAHGRLFGTSSDRAGIGQSGRDGHGKLQLQDAVFFHPRLLDVYGCVQDHQD